MGLIFCPYILIEAEKLARIFDRFMLCFISQENLNLIHGYAIKSHRIFGNFIYGKFIDSVIIGLIALLLTNGIMPAIWTALFIFALQQFDGLILGPRILGDSVGISPFWIICSITIFGSLFGFLGMFLGVPLICVIRMFFNDFLEYRKNRIKD